VRGTTEPNGFPRTARLRKSREFAALRGFRLQALHGELHDRGEELRRSCLCVGDTAADILDQQQQLRGLLGGQALQD
jgi:hypothetical protein